MPDPPVMAERKDKRQGSPRRVTAAEIARLDPYKFMATIGKRVRLQTETGPFEMMTGRGFLADEGFGHSLTVMTKVMARPANVRKMVWLMPRMAKAVPYLGYIVVGGTKPT